MIRIGKKVIRIDEVLLFLYFAIMYAHNLPYPRLFTYCTFAMASYAILKMLSSGNFRIRKTQFSILFWYLIFVAYEFIVSLNNGIYNNSIWNTVIQNIFLLFIMCQYVDSKDSFFRLLKIFAYATLYFGMVAWITSPVNTYGTTSFTGITQSQRNMIAYIVGIGAAIFAYFGIQEKKKKYYVFAILCTIVTVLTGSRKGLVQLVIPVLIYLVCQEGGKRKIKALGTVLILGIIVVFICANSAVFMDAYGTRFFQMFEEESSDASTAVRSDLSVLGMSFFFKKPIFGYGLGASWTLVRNIGFRYVNYFHQNYVELLVSGGLVGFILYTTRFIKCAFTVWRNRRYNNFAKLLISLILIYFVLGIGQVTVYYPSFYTIFFFILQGEAYIAEMVDLPNNGIENERSI